MQDEKKQDNAGQIQPTPVNTFVKPDFNKPNNLTRGKTFNAPQKGGFSPGTFKTQHKG